MKVLHVLANSPPDVNGYAIRTQKILSNQSNELVGLTSPWYPNPIPLNTFLFSRTKTPVLI